MGLSSPWDCKVRLPTRQISASAGPALENDRDRARQSQPLPLAARSLPASPIGHLEPPPSIRSECARMARRLLRFGRGARSSRCDSLPSSCVGAWGNALNILPNGRRSDQRSSDAALSSRPHRNSTRDGFRRCLLRPPRCTRRCQAAPAPIEGQSDNWRGRPLRR